MRQFTISMAPTRRREAGRETPYRCPVGDGQPQDEHSGHRREVRPDQDRRSDGETGQQRPIRHEQEQRERPRRRGRHVAHRVHDLIEEHRTRGDQRRREQPDAGRVEQPAAQQVGQPDSQRAAERHDQKRAAVTGDDLEQRHQQRKSRRIHRRNRPGIPGDGPKAERCPRLGRAWPRRVAHDVLVNLQRPRAPEAGLRHVAVLIGAAGNRRPEGDRQVQDGQRQERCGRRRRRRAPHQGLR